MKLRQLKDDGKYKVSCCCNLLTKTSVRNWNEENWKYIHKSIYVHMESITQHVPFMTRSYQKLLVSCNLLLITIVKRIMQYCTKLVYNLQCTYNCRIIWIYLIVEMAACITDDICVSCTCIWRVTTRIC